MKQSILNFRSIIQKLEDFKRNFEQSRKKFKEISNELKPLLDQFQEIEVKIGENTRLVESFMTSILNTIDSNLRSINNFSNPKFLCDELHPQYFFSNSKNEVEESKENSTIMESHSGHKYDKLTEHDQAYISPDVSLNKENTFYNKPGDFNYDHRSSLYRYNNNSNLDGSMNHNQNFALYTSENLSYSLRPEKKNGSKSKTPNLNSHNTSSSSSTSNGNSSSLKKYKRGPYRVYQISLKQEAIKMIGEGKELKDVSKNLNVPSKNLKRWSKVGPYRKKGGGRKTMDPDMENALFDWCLNEIVTNKKNLTRSLIKQKAKLLSHHPETFKASKGWLDKFMKRFNYLEKSKQMIEDIKKEEKKVVVIDKEISKKMKNENHHSEGNRANLYEHKIMTKKEIKEEDDRFETIFLEEETKNNYE